MSAISSEAFQLLEQLEANNNREWYQAHKADFERLVRKPFALLLEEASRRLARTRLPMQGSARTMFRQNRDTRFSADKRPYKTNVSGLLTADGTKNETQGLLYLHLEADGGFLAAGYYRLEPKQLAPIRDRILSEPAGFRRVLRDLQKAGLEFFEEGRLKSMPRGYEEAKEHPLAEYLKLKSFCVSADLKRTDWLEGKVVPELLRVAKSSQSLLEFCAPQ